MNGKELLKKFAKLMEEHDVSQTNIVYGEVEESFFDLLKSELGEFEVVVDCERTAGDGDFNGSQHVIYFKEHDAYVSFDGDYGSDEGHTYDWNDFSLVKPVEKTIIEYVKIK